MAKPAQATPRRDQSLSRGRIIEASIEILDRRGEDGLTFRALSERLATGPGALYGHIADKSDLVSSACDAVIERTLQHIATGAPETIIRAVALRLFDLIDERPWVGSALTSAHALTPVVRVLECIGAQLRALGVPDEEQWIAAGTLITYILGVSRQNAANRQLAQARGLDRSTFLQAVSTAWEQLDPERYPFTQSVADRVRDHDDREDFLAGINLILQGIGLAPQRRGPRPASAAAPKARKPAGPRKR